MGLGIWNETNKHTGKCNKGCGSVHGGCKQPDLGCHQCNHGDQDLHCYHQMIKEGMNSFMGAQQDFLKAMEETGEAICALKSSREGQLCGIRTMKEAEAFLCQANLQGQCNYCDPHCECLKKEMVQAFSCGMAKEQEALCLLEQALGKLQQAKQDYCRGDEVLEKYMKCIHHKPPCDCMIK